MRNQIKFTLALILFLVPLFTASCSSEQKDKVVANKQQLTQTFFEFYTYENDAKSSDFYYEEYTRDDIRDLARCLSEKTYKKLSEEALDIIAEEQSNSKKKLEEWDQLEDKFNDNELSKDWEVIRKAKYNIYADDCSDDLGKPTKTTDKNKKDLQQTFYNVEYEERKNKENYLSKDEVKKITEYTDCLGRRTYDELSIDALYKLKTPENSSEPLFKTWKDLKKELEEQGLSKDWEIISEYTSVYSTSCK